MVREMAVAEVAAMTLEQAAEYLQVSPDELEEWLEAGALPGTKLPSGAWRVPRSTLEGWLDRHAQLNMRKRSVDVREALRQARELREQILRDRGGQPFPEGFGVEAVREARDRE
jgi:excisionase family DNA binding protein